MANIKKWYKSRTVWVGILTAAVGLATTFATEYPEIGVIVTAKGVLEIALRFITEIKIEK